MTIDLEKWERTHYKISDMKPYGDNPRIITEEKLAELKESMEEVGYIDDIALFNDGTIASGHGRFYIFQDEGADLVPVKKCQEVLTKAQEQEVIIRLNKNVAGFWDFEKLANKFDKGLLLEWGFTDSELIGDWDSNIEDIDKVTENLDGIKGKLKITCKQEDKEELTFYLKDKIMETSFEGVHIE